MKLHVSGRNSVQNVVNMSSMYKVDDRSGEAHEAFCHPLCRDLVPRWQWSDVVISNVTSTDVGNGSSSASEGLVQRYL